MVTDKKSWFQSWVGILVSFLTLCGLIAGAITWQYTTFATNEDVNETVAQLSQETLKGFESVVQTNQQMQRSIHKFELNDAYENTLDQKYKTMKLLQDNPDSDELKKDLEKYIQKLERINKQLEEIK